MSYVNTNNEHELIKIIQTTIFIFGNTFGWTIILSTILY